MKIREVFQDVLMRDGGAERVFKAALGPATSLNVTVGAASQRGLRSSRRVLEPEVLVNMVEGEAKPHEALAEIANAVMDLPRFRQPLLSFHHHFGLLVSSSAGAAYYLHTPTRFLHEPERVSWELPLLSETLRNDLANRETESLGQARLIVTNSSETGRRVFRSYGVTAVVLHPPANLWRFAPSNGGRSLPRRYVLTVGRLSRSKHLDSCLEAVRRSGMEWLIVGEGPPAVAELLRGGATLLGRLDRDSVAALIRGATVCLSPAQEDFGIFAAEAMSLGIPTVAQTGSGIFDLADLGVLRAFADPRTDAGASLESALGSACTAAPANATQVARLRDHLSPEGFRWSLWRLMEQVTGT
jgi:glycosyltransferase involved in cell wall biosynthesis